jgi:hypothetical protein
MDVEGASTGDGSRRPNGIACSYYIALPHLDATGFSTWKRAHLHRKSNRPFQGWATPRLRFLRGLPVGWDLWTPVQHPPMPPAGQVAAPATGAAAGQP